MYAELPYAQYEQLIEVIEKMRNSRKKSFARKVRHINPVCIIQNDMRRKLANLCPLGMRSVEDNYTGVDYLYHGIRIDQKFSFGDKGDNAIVIRTHKRRLLNASDWTMILTREEKVEFFETQKLAEFVKKNWGIVQKNLIEKTLDHEKYRIPLDSFYKNEDITPVRAELTSEALTFALTSIARPQKQITNTLPLFPLICEVQQ